MPGFFGFGMLVGAYLLFPGWPGLAVCGPIRGHCMRHGLRPVLSGFAARAGSTPGGMLARFADRLPVQWARGQSAPVRTNGRGSIGARHGPIGPGLRSIRAHGRATCRVGAVACRGRAARAPGVMLLTAKPPRACISAQCRIRVNPDMIPRGQ